MQCNLYVKQIIGKDGCVILKTKLKDISINQHQTFRLPVAGFQSHVTLLYVRHADIYATAQV